jgi:hypothetical protein
MKKLTNISRGNQRFLVSSIPKAVLWVLLMVGSYFPASAQCDLACNGGNPAAPLMVPLNDSCWLDLVPESVLETPIICPGDKILTVRDTFNTIIISDTNTVNFDPEPYDGQVLSVTVTDVNTGIFCNSFIMPADTTPPEIICTTDTISCIMDTSVQVLGFPLIVDNCTVDTSLELSYTNTFIDFDCQSNETGRLIRTWTVMDLDSNETSCQQIVHIERPKLSDVDFPLDTVLSCDVTDLTLDVTGQPELLGVIIENTNPCDLTVTYEDDTTSICNNIEYQIIRTWTVMETCSQVMATDQQIITVVDTIAPAITCPGPVTTSTVIGACYGSVTLPSPDVVDNCDSEATFFVNTSYGQFGTGPHPFVPVGTHTAQYTSVDACGNTAICTTTINVVDQEAPYAVCKENTIVSIPTPGFAKAYAESFDAGSNDNCADELYFKVRRMITGECEGANGDDSTLGGYQEWFDDAAWFCCEEVGETVQIIFRVYEIDPGDGPVTPTRELPGGDLFGHFSECMVQVELQDKIDPELICPHDTIIDCTSDYTDLSIFGEPMISDNCAFTSDILEEVVIGECNEGVITRTFFAEDPSGNSGSCTQTINVVNLNPLNEDNIIWPQDYTAQVCGSPTDPEDLPNGFDEPQLVNVNCTNTGINYTDDFFNIAFPGCYKILRKWVVIDWCSYDPENPQAGGRFEDTQIIKIEDNSPPVLTCPDNITKAVSSDCSSATVTVPEPTATDCNSNLIISNDSQFAFSDGIDASGVYPLGTTTVKYYASDRCGNVKSCEFNITVDDQTGPGPICIVGLSINLAMMNGEPMAMLNAASFDGGSHDNCTADEDLVRTLRVASTGQPSGPPATSQLTFNCGDVGTKLIEFWVTDESGNSDYCVTAIAVQDNSNVCPQQASGGMIAGDIITEMGQQVEDVMVEVTSTSQMMAYTGANGFFEILDVPMGDDYVVSALRNNDPKNGISTFDIILISRHILGIDPITSPYKLIAADVNRSGSISTLDLIALRKLILGLSTDLPNNNTSWRFIPGDYDFPNPANPFSSDFPESMEVDNFSQDYLEVSFIAVKVGDIDNSATPNDLGDDIENRYIGGTLELELTEKDLKPGDLIEIPFRTDQLDQLLGYQFALGFDTDLLEFVDLEAGDIEGMSSENFNLEYAQEGEIYTSWSHGSGIKGNEKETLFTLSLRSRVALSSLEGLIRIIPGPISAEAYREDGSLLDVSLHFNKLTLTSAQRALDFEVYQNQPNPFREETTIGFELPTAGEAELNVFDLAGKVVYHAKQNYQKGYNEVKVSSADLGNSGIYYYQVRTKAHATTKKMILVE